MTDYEIKTDPKTRRLVWDPIDGMPRAYEWCEDLEMWIEVGTGDEA